MAAADSGGAGKYDRARLPLERHRGLDTVSGRQTDGVEQALLERGQVGQAGDEVARDPGIDADDERLAVRQAVGTDRVVGLQQREEGNIRVHA